MRINVIKGAIITTILINICFANVGYASNILLAGFEYGPTAYDQMVTNLTSVGHSVDFIDARIGGTLAASLSGGSYEQVYLYDLSSVPYLTASDISGLASFWDSHSGLVVDTRSYGYYFQGTEPSEKTLLQNIATNLGLSGGGVWVGTDGDPDWTYNGNPFLLEIGVDLITGNYSDSVNFADPSSVLLSGVTPTNLWASGASVGKAPIGIQPNGIEMFIHFGHVFDDGSILPYISASFPLEGPQPPSVVPEPSTFLLLGGGLAGLAFYARRRKKE